MSFNPNELDAVYMAYVQKCGYSDYCNPLKHELEKSKFGVVSKDGRIVAFTKFRIYNGGIESEMFCWDYSEPKVSLGIAIQSKEIEYAKSLGLEYLYIGPGYEVGSIYKSRFPGFEWWTGYKWSDDVQSYSSLCERDTRVRSGTNMENLESLFDEDFLIENIR